MAIRELRVRLRRGVAAARDNENSHVDLYVAAGNGVWGTVCCCARLRSAGFASWVALHVTDQLEDCTRPQGGLGGSYDTREQRSPPVIRRRRGVRKTESDSQTYDIDRLTRL